MKKPAIHSLAVFLPPHQIDNVEVEKRINAPFANLPNGFLERLLGSKNRFFASQTMQVSDLATEAAKQIIRQNPNISIDLLLFAAASSDLIEPATANIIQHKLGLQCPVMDIKNACNSFVSAIEVATAFLETGRYAHILVVNGEKISEVINFNPRDETQLLRSLSGYSLGDAGVAMLLHRGEERQVKYQKFSSWGEYWSLCTVAGGGSLAFRDPSRYFFEGDARALQTAFQTFGPTFIAECLAEAGYQAHDIDLVVTHQIAARTTTMVAHFTGIAEQKIMNTFSQFGNTAAATIPLALYEAMRQGRLKKGDKLLLLGLAAGVSISVQIIEW